MVVLQEMYKINVFLKWTFNLQIYWVLKVSLVLISHFDINFLFKFFLLCNHPLGFLSLLTLLRISMAKLKLSLGKCYIALENMWVIFKYFLILISNIIPQREGNRLCMISKPLDHERCAPCFMSLDMFQCLLVYSLWELD